MASGVKVADEVKQIFNAMKVVKTEDDEKERIRIVLLHIDTEIKVEKIYRQKDLEDQDDVFKFLKTLLLCDQCRYVLYDCHFEIKENIQKEELVFMMWAPDSAKMKGRMQYASSKSAIQKIVEGVKHTMEVHGIDDMDKDCFTDRLKHKVLKLEGHCATGH
ncbi:cofilin-2-like [Cottoperca gobio]|uniref:Cofilin-2-like n=1 Tax=Cottoperca gobio TaxID=56716 RepID=A0A6J2R4Z4_COTGO|nr:cofilin-2-like [Cottoperca gobio]